MVKQIDKNEARLRRHRRVRNKISGTAARPRLDVFRSAKHIYAQIIDDEGNEIVPEATLTLNSTVIDSRVTWFTTGAAILLLLAGVAQSVRRVRRRVK